MPELRDCTGFQYVQETGYERDSIKKASRPAIAQVETYKQYPLAEKIPLPRKWQLTEEKIVPLLQHRRSLRRYSDAPLSLEELAFLLWASQGITGLSGNYGFRTSPSGGALYPVETYLSIHRVEGLAAGLYHFNVESFCLDQLQTMDSATPVAGACLDQKFMAQSAVIFLWSAVFRRSMSKYGNRGMRYIFLDAGHICQNTLTAAESVNCGGCPVAAFYDDELNALLGLDGDEESVIYSASIGKK